MSGVPTAVVVLAAGMGTRMKSRTPKVLHAIGGRSLLGHVLHAAAPLQATATVVVIGSGRDLVAAHLAEVAPHASTVDQIEQRGTGQATRLAMETLADPAGTVIVLNGDVPLMSSATIAALADEHAARGNAMTVLSADVPNPTGLGRIVRTGDAVTGIVEHKDATARELAGHEINAGAYAFDGTALVRALSRLSRDNAQGEEYLTQVLSLMVTDGLPVGAYIAPDYVETLGCNDRVELAERGRQLNERVVREWMRQGVTVIDPATTWIDVDAELAPDVTIWPNVQLRGATRVETGAEIGPDCTLIDTEVGRDATVIRAHTQLAVIGPDASVGPYTYLRPRAILREGAKAGTFVEMKNADIGAGSKVPHLSYIGDATIGTGSNVGAASVTVNYDGVAKHHTTIGDHCRTGSDNMFIAPVTVGDGAYTGAGSVIRKDVPPGSLAVSGGPQRNFPGWVGNRRPGTASAEAAERARAATDAAEPSDDDETGASR